MRITLINPLYPHFPGSSGEQGYAEPPVGLAYIAAYLRREMGAEVTLIDNCAQNLPDDLLLDRVVTARPDCVGFYSSTITIDRVGMLASSIKQRLPQSKVIVGGPHVSAAPEDLPHSCDAAVMREGEQTIVELLRAFPDNSDLSVVNGVAYRDINRQMRVTPPRDYLPDLDDLPFPAWDLLRDEDYLYQYPTPSKSPYFRAVLTSRGCPFNCSFCAKTAVWGKYVRRRSVGNVLDELRQYQTEGFDLVFFRDDTFNYDPKWLHDLIDGITVLPQRLLWSCLARVDSIDEQTAKRMGASGCFEVQTGVESGNEQIIKTMKSSTLQKFAEGIAVCRRAGIRVKATFILGLPGENETMVKQTIRVARSLKPDYAFFASFIPYPGTAHYDEYKEKGYFTTQDYARYNYHGDPIINTPVLSSEQRLALRRLAYRNFYLRPGRILRFAWDTLRSRRFDAAWRAFSGFLNLTRNSSLSQPG